MSFPNLIRFNHLIFDINQITRITFVGDVWTCLEIEFKDAGKIKVCKADHPNTFDAIREYFCNTLPDMCEKKNREEVYTVQSMIEDAARAQMQEKRIKDKNPHATVRV